MDIGKAVYFVTDRQTTGAGVPAVIRGLYGRARASRSAPGRNKDL